MRSLLMPERYQRAGPNWPIVRGLSRYSSRSGLGGCVHETQRGHAGCTNQTAAVSVWSRVTSIPVRSSSAVEVRTSSPVMASVTS